MIDLGYSEYVANSGGAAMSKDPKREGDQGVSRRGLLEKAALAVGAATSVVAARTALARSSDVVMDSAGRVLVDGAALPPPEGGFKEAVVRNRDNTSCTNSAGCGGGTNTGCNNTKGCVKGPSATRGNTMQKSPGTGTDSKKNTSGRSKSRQ
jgi:hypothetical protein